MTLSFASNRSMIWRSLILMDLSAFWMWCAS